MKWWHWVIGALVLLWFYERGQAAAIGTLGTVSPASTADYGVSSFWEDLTGAGGSPTLVNPPVAVGGYAKQSSMMHSDQKRPTPGFRISLSS